MGDENVVHMHMEFHSVIIKCGAEICRKMNQVEKYVKLHARTHICSYMGANVGKGH